MNLTDAICEDCKHVFTVSKKSCMESWSEMEFECPECGSKNTRVKYSVGDIDIAVGIHGNGQTKYDREFVYKPSRYGKFRGTKVKK